MEMKAKIDEFLDLVRQRNGNEPEFMQAVEEVAETVIPYIVSNDIYHGKNILLRMVEPERLISFRVSSICSPHAKQLSALTPIQCQTHSKHIVIEKI